MGDLRRRLPIVGLVAAILAVALVVAWAVFQERQKAWLKAEQASRLLGRWEGWRLSGDSKQDARAMLSGRPDVILEFHDLQHVTLEVRRGTRGGAGGILGMLSGGTVRYTDPVVATWEVLGTPKDEMFLVLQLPLSKDWEGGYLNMTAAFASEDSFSGILDDKQVVFVRAGSRPMSDER